MSTYANEFDYIEAEMHALMTGSGLTRQETFSPVTAPTKSWYFLDFGDISPTDENDGGSRRTWKVDTVILVGLVARTGNASANAIRSTSNALLADMMQRFEAARNKERVFVAADGSYTVRVQEMKITAPSGAFADTATTGWAVIRGEVHYDRS